MIVKGIIKTINFSDNSCTVRLPIFETAAAQGEVVLDAIILIQPGLYNGYAIGDVVFVDFENNKLSQPIVIGKLYLGAAKETAAGAPSAMTVSNLKVTTQATLPIDTKLTLEGTGTTVPVENGITTYKSLIDIIKALHKTETSIEQTIKDQSSTLANIKVEYLSQPVDAAMPEEGDPNWNISAPAYQDGYSIWQKTTCYNHRGQVLNAEILCLSGVASAVIYKLRCSTRVHAGTNQTESIKISAWVKFGTELETLDTTANICYCWSDSKGNLTSSWTETNSYDIVLTAAQLQAQNLIIQVKHGAEIYEEETIMYAPLNTPVLTLSNDTDVLLYAANGTDCVTKGGVKSTATLYVNGDPLEAEYNWTWDGTHCTCDFERDDQGNIVPSKRTIIVTAVNSTDVPGVVTCTATVTLEGPFKGKSYSKEFTVTQTKIGTSIISQETYYALVHNKHGAGDLNAPTNTGDLTIRDENGNQLSTKNEASAEEWSITPPEHTVNTNGWKYWTTIKTTYSTSLDDFEFSTPIISEDLNGVYALARGKTTTYYGEKEPTADPQKAASNSSKYVYTPGLRENDSWFNTAPASGVGGELRQWNGTEWLDISDEIVANKVTTAYVDALDVTAKKIKVLDTDNTTLFEADGLNGAHKVQIGGYNVVGSTLTTGTSSNKNQIILDGTNNLTSTSARLTIGDNFKVLADGTVIAKNLYLEDKTDSSVMAADQIEAITADIEEINTVKLTALEASIGAINTNKIEVKNSSNTTIFKADGVTAGLADGNRVQIGGSSGFKVGTKKLYAGSGTNYVELGTEAIMLGGTTTSAAPFSVTKAGYLKSESGLIGGFDISAAGIYSTNDSIQMRSNGKLVATDVDLEGTITATGGQIGGFKIEGNNLNSSSIALSPTQVYFPSGSQLNLGNEIFINDTTRDPVTGKATSYISTKSARNFEIKNGAGAGLRFLANTSAQKVNVTLTLNNPKVAEVADGPSYGGHGYYFQDMDAVLSLDYKLTNASGGLTSLSEPVQVDFYITYDGALVGSDPKYEKRTFTINANTTSGTYRTVMYGWTAGGTVTLRPSHNASKIICWTESGTYRNSLTKTLVSIDNTNTVLYSLGSFYPVSTSCLLGVTGSPWGSVASQTPVIVTSDAKAKNTISEITPAYEQLFDALKPVTYKYNNGTSDRLHTGFIAQDVEQAVYSAGLTTKDFAGICIEADSYALRYEEFIALNTAQIQKLKQQVVDQEARIEELERIIKDFKN